MFAKSAVSGSPLYHATFSDIFRSNLPFGTSIILLGLAELLLRGASEMFGSSKRCIGTARLNIMLPIITGRRCIMVFWSLERSIL